MLRILLLVVSFILFLCVGFGQTLFNHAGLELTAFGLAAWVLGELLGGVVLSGITWTRK